MEWNGFPAWLVNYRDDTFNIDFNEHTMISKEVQNATGELLLSPKWLKITYFLI